MKKELCSAVMASIEELLQVPGTQLQHIESTLRQLMTDLKNANLFSMPRTALIVDKTDGYEVVTEVRL